MTSQNEPAPADSSAPTASRIGHIVLPCVTIIFVILFILPGSAIGLSFRLSGIHNHDDILGFFAAHPHYDRAFECLLTTVEYLRRHVPTLRWLYDLEFKLAAGFEP